MKGISHNFGYMFWFIGVLIRFWGQKVKGKRQWPKNQVNTISL